MGFAFCCQMVGPDHGQGRVFFLSSFSIYIVRPDISMYEMFDVVLH